MPIAGGQANRFEMLINIAVGGAGNLDKVASGAKQAAINMRDVDRTLKDTSVTMEEQINNIERFRSRIDQFVEARTNLKVAEREYQEAMANTSVASEENIARLMEKRQQMEELEDRTRSLGEAVNKFAGEDIIRLNEEVSKSTVSQIRLGEVNEVLTKRQEELGRAIRRVQREEESKISTGEQLTESVNRTSSAVRRNRQEWGLFQQRLGAGAGAVTVFRRSLGALRNQILVVMFATAGLRRVVREALDAIREKETAMRALRSMALGTGNDMDSVTASVQRFVDTGLVTAAEASNAMNNLLSMNLTLEQSEKLFHTVADAVAVNRDANKSLGQAIDETVVAIKNKQNRRIDAAGFTVRVTDLEKQYAASLGTTADNLDDNQKVQAIYTGLLRDGARYAGEASRSFETLAGASNTLAVRTNAARVALGDGLTPAIQMFYGWLIRGQEALEHFFTEYRDDVITVTTAAIEAFTGAVGAVVGTVAKVGKGINAVFGGDSSVLGQGLVILTKVAVGLRLMNRMASDSDKVMEKLQATTKGYNVDLKNQHALQRISNSETGRAVGGLTALRVRYAAARIEISKKQVALQRLSAQQAASNVKWSTTNAALTTARANFLGIVAPIKAATMAIGSMSAAVSVLWAAVRSLFLFLGKLAVVFFAVEGIIRLVRWFSEASDRAQAFERDVREMDESIARLTGRIENMMLVASRAFRVGATFGIDVGELDSARRDIEQSFSRIRDLQQQYRNEENEDARRALEEKIDLEKAYIDEREEVLRLAGMRILDMESSLMEARSAVSEAYFDEQKQLNQRLGLEGINQAEESFRDFLEVQQNFNENRAILAGRSARLVEIEEEKLTETLRLINERRNQVLLDIREDFNHDILGIIDQNRQLQVQGIVNQFDQIEAAHLHQKDSNLKALEDLVNETAQHLDDYVDLFRRRGREAAHALEDTIIRLDTSAAIRNLIDRFSEGGRGRTISQLSGQIVSLNHEFQAGNIDVENYTRRIDQYHNILGELHDQLNPNIFSHRELRDEISEVRDMLRDISIAGNVSADVHDRLNQIVGEQDRTMQELNETYGELSQEIIDHLDLLERQALSQEALNQSMELMAHNTRLLEFEERSRLDNLQLETELKMLDVQYERGRAVAALIGPMQGLLELRRDHNAELREAEIQHNQTMEQFQSELRVLDDQIDHLEELLAGKQSLSGAERQLEEAEIQRVQTTLELLYKEREAVYGNMEAYDAFHELFMERLEEIQKQEAFQELVSGLKQVADSIVNLASSFSDQLRGVQTEQKIYLDTLNEELAHGEITQQQFMQEKLAAQEYFNKKMEYERKRAMADLVRTVGREIALFAARKAAQSGNIAAAVGLLVAGGAVGFLANNLASRIEAGAERDFAAAERLFQRRVAEIRDEGDSPTAARQFGGSIRAETLQVTISPTVVVSGEQVFIGSGTISEFSNEVSALILSTTQQAIDNRQIDLSSIRSLGG